MADWDSEDTAEPLSTDDRLLRLEAELIQCIGGDLDFRMTLSPAGDDLDAIATGINVLLDEVQHVMAEAEARRRAEEALQKQALLFESIRDGVSVIGPEGHIVAWNPAAGVLFGLPAEQVLGQRPFPMLDEGAAQERDAEARAAIASGEAWQTEITTAGVRGATRICEVSVIPVDGDAVSRVQLYRDVTDARLLEQRLRHVERLKSLGLLAGGIAHDFNNQLTGVQAAAEVLALRLDGPARETLMTYVQSILTSVHRASQLTTQLLTFARRSPMSADAIDMDVVLKEVVHLVERTVDKRYRVHLELGPHTGSVIGDSSQLQNLFLNIVLNAREAMPAGGRISVLTEEGWHGGGPLGDPPLPVEGGPCLRVTVRDTGVGMSREIKRRIFEPFFTTKPQGQGVGMGLSAVFGVVKGHGGAIEVESEPGEGALFTIVLPLSSQPSDLAVVHHEADTNKGRLEGKHVLIVDDEELILSLTTDILVMEGVRVVSHADGRQALAYFEDHAEEIDAVVLDMMMPAMHGRDVLARMRQVRDVPVVICSGFNDAEQGVDVFGSTSPVCFLRKPYELRELTQALVDVIEQGAGG